MHHRHIILNGMMGLGDNIHQRAIVRHFMRKFVVWLETPWPTVYHDMVGDRLRLMRKGSHLRTQAKNEIRQSDLFTTATPPKGTPSSRIWYSHEQVKKAGSFLGGMTVNSRVPLPTDFSLPIPPEWDALADEWIARWTPTKPLMIYRPLMDRAEWDGCKQRNPDSDHYATLAESVRDRFFVVSVADLEPGKEWLVGRNLVPDVAVHAGELSLEAMAALFARAGLIYASPGFAVILAQAVGAPLCAVFGGHESARLYDHGRHNNLMVSPINPCECFSKTHPCDKSIDMPAAVRALREFTA